jgi:signal transduction histidine kinase
MYLAPPSGTLAHMLLQSPHHVEHGTAGAACCGCCSARIIEAGDRERRRLERDLHDGAQQRLVSLALQLSTLRRRLAPGSEAELLLAAAQDELTASLTELRDLAHGIHPAVLTDRGLGPALEALAARSSLPVDVTAAVERRFDAVVETAAYYFVSEALTNAAKHAHATRMTVRAFVAGARLVVVVTDDGAGGADVAGGSGLRGLADRVEALGGTLRVASRPGIGTSLRAAIPVSRSSSR